MSNYIPTTKKAYLNLFGGVFGSSYYPGHTKALRIPLWRSKRSLRDSNIPLFDVNIVIGRKELWFGTNILFKPARKRQAPPTPTPNSEAREGKESTNLAEGADNE